MTIGLIPAAGRAVRLSYLPKYLLPVGNTYLLADLCSRMHMGGVTRFLIGANSDNLSLLGRHAPHDASLYCIDSVTMNETLLAARPHLTRAETVLFGMPDTYWTDATVYPRLAQDVAEGALVSVALFQARPGQHKAAGMCEVAFDDDDLIIRHVIDKPEETSMTLLWGAAAWRGDFWQYIEARDAHVGFALQRAIWDRRLVRGILANGPYFDCGTPDGYYACIRHLTEGKQEAVSHAG